MPANQRRLMKVGSILTDANGQRYKIYAMTTMVHTTVVDGFTGVDFGFQVAEEMFERTRNATD